MFGQKGVALIQILIISLALITGVAVLSRSLPIKSAPQPSNSPSTQLTTSFQSKETSIEPNFQPTPSTKSAAKTSCNPKTDLCFESNNLKATITEGYLEDAYYWITEDIFLTGKGSGGYQLKIEGFPKEFTVRSPVQDFKDGNKQKIYIRAQKDVAKKGSYSGKISVYSYLSGNTTSADLSLNYTDWNDSSIHIYPLEVNLNCKITYSGWPSNKYLDCGGYDNTGTVKLYYFGNHKGIEVRTVIDKDVKRSLKLKGLYNETTFDINNVKTLNIEYVGFPASKDLENEPSGTYKGSFVFIDQATQKEILKTPYTLKIAAEK